MAKFKRKARKFPKRKFAKKAKKTWRKKGGFRKSTGNIAATTETIDLGKFPGLTVTPTAACTLSTVSLDQFARSLIVAQNFRFYRITKVTYEYMPEANMFQAGTALVPTLPYMTSVMCRDGNFNGTGYTAAGVYSDLLEMGAKPQRFNKVKRISYVPNICLATSGLTADGASTGSAVQYVTRKKMPWLSTVQESTGAPSPTAGSSWKHFGHQWFLGADVTDIGQVLYNLKVTAHFQFKQPLAPPSGT